MRDPRPRGSLVATAAAVAGAIGWRAHRAALNAVRAAVREEREWSRRLRDELQTSNAREQPMGEGDDVRDLVMRTAMGLLGAQKGVLLSHSDEDRDGDFDLICVRGFVADPEHLPVVQRFTGLALARDEIMREDDVRDDSEIDCLVAVPVYLFDRFHGVVICANRPGGFDEVEDDVLLALGDHAGAALHSQRLYRSMRDTHRGAIRMLTELQSAHDAGLGSAAVEAATLGASIARRMGIEGPERDTLVCAAALRDIGLVAIPTRILAQPGPLAPEEYAVVRRHAQIAFDVLNQVPELREIAFTVLYHHERYDGAGYPAGLAGDAIPKAARVVAVLDAWCAITRDRPHRPARAGAVAMQELVEHAGSQFDPEVVALLLEEVRNPQLRHVDADTAEAAMSWLLLPERGATEAANAADRLASAADGLTQLGAHRAFREAAATAATDDAPFAVLLVEAEGVRSTNERAGYAAGDRALVDAARILQRVAGRAGLLAYRLGGLVFGVVAPGFDADGARRLLDDTTVEFALGPPVRVAAAVRRDDQGADAVIAAARRDLHPVSAEAIGARDPSR